MKSLLKISLATLALSLALPLAAEETQIMVRAKAVDSKFIGSSAGGIKVVIEDAETNEILDQGWITGSTGDTPTIMENPIQRGQPLADEKTAGYLATVDLSSPRLLRFKLIGPYAYRQSLQEATVTSWVVPGKHILGDGIVLNMPGFIVDAWNQVLEGGDVTIITKAALLCGCPIKEDGLWQAGDYEVTAIIMQDDKRISEVTLDFTGPVGMFSGKTNISEPGHYKAIVYVFDPKTGNVGVDRTMFEITD